MSSCTILRRMTITHGTLNITTGEVKPNISSEVVTRECGVPLFGDTEKKRGICNACAEGWEVRGNLFASEFEMWRAKREQ